MFVRINDLTVHRQTFPQQQLHPSSTRLTPLRVNQFYGINHRSQCHNWQPFDTTSAVPLDQQYHPPSSSVLTASPALTHTFHDRTEHLHLNQHIPQSLNLHSLNRDVDDGVLLPRPQTPRNIAAPIITPIQVPRSHDQSSREQLQQQTVSIPPTPRTTGKIAESSASLPPSMPIPHKPQMPRDTHEGNETAHKMSISSLLCED